MLLSGNLLGFGVTNLPFGVSRNSTAAFAELSLPISRSLEAQIAVRSERYSDFGSSTNPKFGIRYQPIAAIALRASGGTSFRAPSLLEANYPQSNTAGSVFDTTRCAALGIAVAQCPLTPVNLTLGSSPAIGPERAKNYSLGLVVSPSKNISAAIDYINIKYKDKIGLNTGTVFPSGGAPVNEAFVRRGAPAPGDTPGIPAPITDVALVFDNVFGETRYSAFDFLTEANFAIGSGRLTIDMTGTYLQSYKQSNTKNGPLANLTGGYSYPRLKGSLGSTYSNSFWAGTVRLNHIGSYRDDAANVGLTNRVGVDLTTDVQLEYTGVKNLKLALGAKNLLDKNPPFSSQFTQGFNISLSNPTGRYIYFRANFKFW